VAGIGFRLAKLLRSDDPYSQVTGVVASIFLSSGPWLCTILSIFAISILSSPNVDPLDHQVFRIIINYTYVGSLVLFSLIEMVATRYLADNIYLKQERVIPTLFCWIAIGVMGLAIALGTAFYSFAYLPWQVTLMAVTLLAAVTLIWAATVFLSACKDYLRITMAFFFGMIVSVGGSYVFGNELGLGMKGQLLGYTLGQVLIATELSIRIFREFGTGFLNPSDFPEYFQRKRIFAFLALSYALAIWVDKIIFWLAPATSERVASIFFKSSAYDAGIFLAYLTIVPSAAYFLVQIETRFYMAYRRYLSMMDNRAPLMLIDRRRTELIEILRRDTSRLVIFQAFITVPCVILAPEILAALDLPILYATVFRYGLLGAAMHILVLFSNIILMYFDSPTVALRNYFLFLMLNGALAYGTTFLDRRFHGMGYALATLVTLVVSILSLNDVLARATFLIFNRQPLSTPAVRPLEFDRLSLK